MIRAIERHNKLTKNEKKQVYWVLELIMEYYICLVSSVSNSKINFGGDNLNVN